jgi:site-specific DNA recombinase
MQTVKRCAIYTRKSHEEGLEMEFNSLDAQREAAEAYIASQKTNGWVCLPEHYDDGGFSGGTLNRPALKKLLDDCKDGKIDIVVVYKIDRLSRSLCDFAELSRKFEEWNVAFVSVTQEINTNTSAGRMMLNILMTFAQFEREIIAERIRDKMSSARKKGKYIGGILPIGYRADAAAMKIVVVPKEAKIVRLIFDTFLESCSIKEVQRELARQGIKTPVRKSKKGRSYGGRAINYAVIRSILQNPIYIGKVRYRGEDYDGEHEGIIPEEQFQEAQRWLKTKVISHPSAEVENPFTGLIFCGHCGTAMFRTKKTNQSGRQYHYYVCIGDQRRAFKECPVHRVSANDIDRIVQNQIEVILNTPTMLAKVSLGEIAPEILRSEVTDMKTVWACMFPAERRKLARALIKKILIFEDEIKLVFRGKDVAVALSDCGINCEVENAASGQEYVISLPFHRKRYGNRTVIVLDEEPPETGGLNQMQSALIKANRGMDALISGEKPTIDAVAGDLGVDRSFVAKNLQLANLAPDIAKMIWEGRQPKGLTLHKLREGIPDSWAEQRRVLLG